MLALIWSSVTPGKGYTKPGTSALLLMSAPLQFTSNPLTSSGPPTQLSVEEIMKYKRVRERVRIEQEREKKVGGIKELD